MQRSEVRRIAHSSQILDELARKKHIITDESTVVEKTVSRVLKHLDQRREEDNKLNIHERQLVKLNHKVIGKMVNKEAKVRNQSYKAKQRFRATLTEPPEHNKTVSQGTTGFKSVGSKGPDQS